MTNNGVMLVRERTNTDDFQNARMPNDLTYDDMTRRSVCNIEQSDQDDGFVKAISCSGEQEEVREQAKTSSVIIIFNTWNAMIGCGTVTLPWAFQQSGVLLGILITAVACLFAFLTNYMILQISGSDTNFSNTMHKLFPRWGWAVSMACFIVNFYVGIILFYQVLSQSLYPILLFVFGIDAPIEMETNWSEFSLSYTCLIILAISLVMTAPRDTMYIQKVNAFGVCFVVVFLLFVISQGISSITETDFIYTKSSWDAYLNSSTEQTQSYAAHIPLVKSQFTPLMGILGGGFYFHNMSLSTVQHARYPEHNTRNILIGFVLVFLTYSLIGITGVYGFSGAAFAAEQPSINGIKENCLNMFAADNKWATFIRFCIICQLLCVNTLLFGLLREQILLLYKGVREGIASVSQVRPMLPFGENLALTFAMSIPPLALAIWYPHVGKLGALIAAFSTMFVIYILPLSSFVKAVFLAEQRRRLDDDFTEPCDVEAPLQSSNKVPFEMNASTAKLADATESLISKSVISNTAAIAGPCSVPFRQVAVFSSLLAGYGVTVFLIQLFYLAASFKEAN